MPRRDGTGPMGQGMMTGRRLGNCQVKSLTSKELLLEQKELLKIRLEILNKELERLV